MVQLQLITVRRSRLGIQAKAANAASTRVILKAGCKVGVAQFLGHDRLIRAHRVREPHTSTTVVAHYMGGRSTGPRTQRDLQRISEANLKHGQQTKDKLGAQRHAATVGRRVQSEL